jgi:hypothetical protein
LFSFPLCALQAQKKDSLITLLGNLYNSRTFEPVEFAHVINVKDYGATITDSLGNFKINIEKGDTLLITSIGYENKKYVYDGAYQQTIFESIPMEERVYQIEQVEITPWGTYREFKNKFMSLETDNPRDKVHPLLWKDLPEKPDTVEPFVPGLTNPISFLYYMFSSEGKSLRKYRELKMEQTKKDKIRSKYNKQLVADLTGLEGKELERFMKFCNFTDEYILNTRKYLILKRVKELYKLYKEKENKLNQNNNGPNDSSIQRH